MLKLCKKNKLINVSTLGGGQESPCKIIRYTGDNIPNDIQWNDGDLYIDTRQSFGLNSQSETGKVYKYVSSYDDQGEATFVEDSFKQGYLYYDAQNQKTSVYDNGVLVPIFEPANDLTVDGLRTLVNQELDEKLNVIEVSKILIPQIDNPADPAEFVYEGDGIPVAVNGYQDAAPVTVTPENSELIYIDKFTDTIPDDVEPQIDPGVYLIDTNGIVYNTWTTTNANISSEAVNGAIAISNGINAQIVLPNGGLSLKNNSSL